MPDKRPPQPDGDGSPAPPAPEDGAGGVRLGRDDWIVAAYDMLGEGGATAISVERLAARLGVTKGSFYWHFRDRAELLDALRQRWTGQLVISRVEASGGDAPTKIRNLLDIVVRAGRGKRGGSLELAMRSWARRDPATARVVELADQERLDYTARLFRELGFAPDEAEARAFLLYAYIFSQGVFTFADETALRARIHALCRGLIAGDGAIGEAGAGPAAPADPAPQAGR